jgi:hypothetical protein
LHPCVFFTRKFEIESMLQRRLLQGTQWSNNVSKYHEIK